MDSKFFDGKESIGYGTYSPASESRSVAENTANSHCNFFLTQYLSKMLGPRGCHARGWTPFVYHMETIWDSQKKVYVRAAHHHYKATAVATTLIVLSIMAGTGYLFPDKKSEAQEWWGSDEVFHKIFAALNLLLISLAVGAGSAFIHQRRRGPAYTMTGGSGYGVAGENNEFGEPIVIPSRVTSSRKKYCVPLLTGSLVFGALAIGFMVTSILDPNLIFNPIANSEYSHIGAGVATAIVTGGVAALLQFGIAKTSQCISKCKRTEKEVAFDPLVLN